MAAREKVKGCDLKLLELTRQLQREATEGRLGEEAHVSTHGNSNDEQARENSHSEYEESDDEIHTPPDSGDELTDKVKVRRGALIGENIDFRVFKWQAGKRFATRVEFKKAVAKFVLLQGRNLRISTSNKSRQKRLGCFVTVVAPSNYMNLGILGKQPML